MPEELVADNIKVFRAVDQVQPIPVEEPRVFIDTTASSHMVSDRSQTAKHTIDKEECRVRPTGSYGTSSATKKG